MSLLFVLFLLLVVTFVLLLLLLDFFGSFNSKSMDRNEDKPPTTKRKRLSTLLYFHLFSMYLFVFLLFILVSILFVQECECVCVCTALLCTNKPCMKKLLLILKEIFCIYMFYFLHLHVVAVDLNHIEQVEEIASKPD